MRRFNSARRVKGGVLGLVATTSLVLFAVYRLGWPLTTFTWLVVSLAAVSGAVVASPQKPVQRLFWASLAGCLYLAFPFPFQVVPMVEVWSLFDGAGGRSGWQITPGLRFGHVGPNTRLMESYVGPLKPVWASRAPHFPPIRDGDNRVHSRNVIRRECFAEILDMLPDDAARNAVIHCLTDQQNFLRAHQSLLLTCLYVRGYPPGTDRASWWKRHQNVLISEHDPHRAASLTHGWLEHFYEALSHSSWDYPASGQLQAVDCQRKGQWGGDEEFGEAFRQIQYGRTPALPDAVKASSRIGWWPSQRPEEQSRERK